MVHIKYSHGKTNYIFTLHHEQSLNYFVFPAGSTNTGIPQAATASQPNLGFESTNYDFLQLATNQQQQQQAPPPQTLPMPQFTENPRNVKFVAGTFFKKFIFKSRIKNESS